ncbi:MAG TPA: leucyl aminopeptidase [Gammaproteobacteria bacterium]|nr:leucyl aminopeptidase [Gammaproteobacteria bacterium]
MEFSVLAGQPEQYGGACVIAGVFEDQKLTAAAAALDKASQGTIGKLIESGALSGKTGKLLPLFKPAGLDCGLVLLVGLGARDKFDALALRKATSAAVKAVASHGIKEALNTLTLGDEGGLDLYWRLRHGAEAASDASYSFRECKSKNGDDKPLETLKFSLPAGADEGAAKEALRHAKAIASGVSFAKDLGNRPANLCTPTHLAEQAQELAKRHPKIKITVVDEAEMEKLGMGALLAVSRGSHQPAKLIVMEYQGGGNGDKPYALVGKGVTFDAGGISLKPPASMDEMKWDMGGAASVFGALQTVAELDLPVNVVGVTPCTENLPGGNAVKPGDIVTTMSGQTVEILNTDAEGRLCLCDALCYTERFEPQTVIDIATLTGACVIALGSHAAGLFSNDEEMVADLLKASTETTDRAWRMPLWDDYQEQLQSNFADFANVGGREAGSITAACYLSRFTGNFRWAHLDIAGVAWKTGKEKGGTGRPVTLLSQYLIERANNQS